jgi:hypothetical protein
MRRPTEAASGFDDRSPLGGDELDVAVEACRSCPAATFSIVQLVETMYVSLTCCARSCRVYGLVRSMRHSGL